MKWLTSLTFLILLLALRFNTSNSKIDALFNKALLVIAHPDDEVMFFSPTLNYFKDNDLELGVLCLSNGKFGFKYY